MKVLTGTSPGPEEASAELQRGRALKHTHKSTVEKEWLSHRRTQNTRTDTCVGHRTLIMKPDGE